MKIDNVAVISLDDYAEYMELKKGKALGRGWYHLKPDNRFSDYASNALLYYNCKDDSYGFSFHIMEWTDEFYIKPHLDLIIRLATSKEVETALINEAKRRGLVKGSNFTSPWMTGESDNDVDGDYYLKDDALYIGTGLINYTLFRDGHWAEPVEVDKFDDLKKAHAEGAEIEFRNSSRVWDITKNPLWDENREYRIRPLKAGDWIQYGNGIDAFEFIKISHETVPEYQYYLRVKDQDLINKLNSLAKSND